VNRLFLIFAGALLAGGCSSSTGPTPVPTPDPPKITCPAPQTIQLTSNVTSVSVTYASPTTINGKLPVTTACAPASGSSFGIGKTSVSCTATDALQRTDACSFLITVLSPVPPPILAATSFLAFGDSITRGEDGRNSLSATSTRFYPRVLLPDAQTYPGLLQQSLVDRYRTQSPKVDNRGFPGEAVTDTDPDTFARFVTLTSSRRYDAVLIMEGSNDLMLATRDSTVPERAAVRLRQMVGDAKSRGIRPLLATIPPMNPAGSRGKDWGADLVPGFNDRIRSVAAAENVTLVDIYQGFGGNLALLSADGLHPNTDGYQKIADVFFSAIRSTLEITTPASSLRTRR
jgi:lysophospholipase L1-like esterase